MVSKNLPRSTFWLILCELPRQSQDPWVEAPIWGRNEGAVGIGGLCKLLLPPRS